MFTVTFENTSPIEECKVTCKEDGLKTYVKLSNFDSEGIFLHAIEMRCGEEHEAAVAISFDEAEEFFKAGLELIAQQRARHGGKS